MTLLGRDLRGSNAFLLKGGGGVADPAEQLVDEGYFDVVWDLTRMVDSTVPSYPAGYEGTATGVTVQQTVVPWTDRLAPTFNGISSWIDIFTAALAAIHDPDAFSLYTVAGVSGAGVWTDGVERVIALFGQDNNNRHDISKHDINNNTLRWRIRRGAVNTFPTATYSDTELFSAGLAVEDVTADLGQAFLNGAQAGVDQTGLGTYVGGLATAVIGQFGIISKNYWSGPIPLVGVKFGLPVHTTTEQAAIDSILGMS